MARVYLPEGYEFRRDCARAGKNKAIDLQAGHTSRRAGLDYGRDACEVAGQIASLRAEYRQVSTHWHTFLGFGVDLPPRDATRSGTQRRQRQV